MSEDLLELTRKTMRYVYRRGYEDGVNATNVDCGVVWEERIDAIKDEIAEKISHYDHFASSNTANGLNMALDIIDKHIGGE